VDSEGEEGGKGQTVTQTRGANRFPLLPGKGKKRKKTDGAGPSKKNKGTFPANPIVVKGKKKEKTFLPPLRLKKGGGKKERRPVFHRKKVP